LSSSEENVTELMGDRTNPAGLHAKASGDYGLGYGIEIGVCICRLIGCPFGRTRIASEQEAPGVDIAVLSQNKNPRRLIGMSRKPYEPPAVVHTEKLEARAIICAKETAACNPNPIQS